MLSEFSSGYYLGRLYVEPRRGERAVMHREQHEEVNQHVYAEGEGVERLDAPLVVKLDNRHFAVHGEPDVPQDTVGVPGHLLADVDVRNPPALREILVAKADRAAQLLRLSGQLDDPAGDGRGVSPRGDGDDRNPGDGFDPQVGI